MKSAGFSPCGKNLYNKRITRAASWNDALEGEKEALVRVRLLDEQLYNRYRLPLTELSVPVSQLEALDLLRGQRCIVTENEMTFLTLPPYHEEHALFSISPRTICAWNRNTSATPTR